jgi:U4/U6.U5 tri-snRNP-associated protein 2
VSPLELLLVVQERSQRRFRVDRQSDPIEFLTWLLNTLHFDLTKGKPQKRQSIVTRCFQGEMKVTKIKDRRANNNSDDTNMEVDKEEEKEEIVHVPFLMLGLDLPPTPLFKDSLEKNIIPQVPLFTLLQKYDGVTVSESIRQGRMKYQLTMLPPNLIVWAKRFTKNNFFKEKNPTIITFPVKNLELSDHIPVPKQKKKKKNNNKNSTVVDQNQEEGEFHSTKYDLVATGIHEGKPGEGSYSCMLYHYPDQEWYHVEDLNVKEVRPEIVAIAEAYFQIYTRKE